MNLKKTFALAGFLCASFAVTLQFYLILFAAHRDGASYVSESIRFLSYMTIWTNILVAFCFGSVAVFPGTRLGAFFNRPSLHAATFVYIIVVGVSYLFLLSHIWEPQGWQYVADVLLHYAVPVLFVVYWLFLAEKVLVPFDRAIRWLFYPAVYFVYALARGVIVNEYPYPFIDVNELGYQAVFINSLFLLVAYLVLALITITISRKLSKSGS